jgi:hypothetical protein
MLVNRDSLEKVLASFIIFVSKKDGRLFTKFSDSLYVSREEGYKYLIAEEAQKYLGGKKSLYSWKESDIGSGLIQNAVNKAIRQEGNNLVYRGSQRNYLASDPVDSLERSLYDFYKNRRSPENVFNDLIKEGILYQLMAYLFFIKDKERFLPISQERFDDIFEVLGVHDFKTYRNVSWENYCKYIDIVREVQGFLMDKGYQANLLDAHSFLWIFGNQMQLEKYIWSEAIGAAASRTEQNINQTDQAYDQTENGESIFDEYEEDGFSEGREIYKLHKSKERSLALVKLVKASGLKMDPYLRCEICGFSFKEKYGYMGDGYIEAHHMYPISELSEETVTRVEDMILVCSNCHRMLHRRRPWITIGELHNFLNEQ